MSIVMEGEVAEYQLGVRDMDYFRDKLFCPVGTIDEAADIARWKFCIS